jgi:hypothetical protein
MHGGSLFALLEPLGSASADSLVEQFGIRVDPTFVIDRSAQQRNATNGASDRIAMARGANQKFSATAGFGYVTLYPIACSLSSVQPSAPGVTLTKIVQTSPDAWGETTLSQMGDPKASYDEGVDRKGPLTLAYAAKIDLRVFQLDWRTQGQGLEQTVREMNPEAFGQSAPGDTVRVKGEQLVQEHSRTARLVLTGDVDFVNNANLLVQGNGDLFLDLLLWLSQRENRIALGPGPELFEPILLTKHQVFWLRVLGVGVVPGIFFLSALLVVWRRRKWI